MRKLAVIGAVATATLAAATGARAATETYNINGNLSNSVNSCFNIAVSLTETDCSYARTRIPAYPIASGPKFTGGFYARGSVGDNIAYLPLPNDGKVALGVTGTVTIDDAGSAGDPTDDLISMDFTIEGGIQNAATGNGDRAIERWTSWHHVMAPTAVNAATVSGASIEYVIGARTATVGGSPRVGKPTPDPLCSAADPSGTDPDNCIATELAPATQDDPGFWDTSFAGLPNPATNRIGIERSPGFGLYPGVLTPNVGGQTTGTFTGYECVDTAGDTDCIGSEILFGSSAITYRNENGTAAVHPTLGNCQDGIDNDGTGGTDAADPQCVPLASTQPTHAPTPVLVSPPGFENVVLVLTKDGLGAITSARAYWTREYIIASGPRIGNDADGDYDTNNSYGAGLIRFTGTLPQTVPTVVDDAINVTENVAASLNVAANDTLGSGINTISIEGAGPQNGTIGPIAPGDSAVSYTPDTNFSGTDTFDYRLTDDDGDFDVGTVTVTVSERVPIAGTFNASSSGGNPTAAIPVLGAPTVLGTGTAGEHTVAASGGANGGSCSASGSSVIFTPTPGFNGAGFCEFLVTDVDGDSDTGRLNVSVTNNTGGGGGGSGGPQLPSGGSSLDLLTLAALLAGAPLWARRRRRLH